MKELASLHDQHLNRPTLDDSSEQEHAIEITTQEITQVRMEVDPQVGTGISQPSDDSLRSWNMVQLQIRLQVSFLEFRFPTQSSQRGFRRP